jgi:hypothetical protein
MINKKIIVPICLLLISCKPNINNSDIIKKVSNDNLIIKQVNIIETSNYKNTIKNLDNSIETSIKAWEDSPELGQYNRTNTIRKVTEKFKNKLKYNNYNDDAIITAYRFIKSDRIKLYMGYCVIILDNNQNPNLLYYEINTYNTYEDCPTSIKQLINRGLSNEINHIENKYYKKNKK